MDWPTKNDVKMLNSMSREELLQLFFLHIKNIWRVDGLYFLGIEEEFGTTAATQIDTYCWNIIGKLEARELRWALRIKKKDITALLQALKNSSWALYQIGKEYEASEKKGVFRVTRCRTQETRVNKGLGEFPCKQVRLSYLQSFAKEFNQRIEVVCKACPPEAHSNNVWCEWEFILH
ncbi:MAG: hypothetical protein JSV05_09760 [Candidatus Bathyarchaeota archaeon]|nr:MAG: hypothetical protein JSV05_09760 [Candidatus Bathyarchaeota archaeon]